jgi:hypothetical protein
MLPIPINNIPTFLSKKKSNQLTWRKIFKKTKTKTKKKIKIKLAQADESKEMGDQFTVKAAGRGRQQCGAAGHRVKLPGRVTDLDRPFL